MQACIYGGDGQAVLRVFSTHDGWKIHHGWFSKLYLCQKSVSKISYSFSRGDHSITRFVKQRIRKRFSFKGVFFVKLLGITFFRLFIKTVLPRYNITHLSTSQVQNAFQLHFLFENIDTIPKLHGLSTVLDRGRGYSNSFYLCRGVHFTHNKQRYRWESLPDCQMTIHECY